MPRHELKTWPESFQPLISGAKTCEFRKADRDFRRGDVLVLREYLPTNDQYTGRELHAMITHISRNPDFGIPDGYVILSIRLEAATHNPLHTPAAR